MSEFVDAEIHETDETVELRWSYNGVRYGIKMGHDMLDVLELPQGAKTAILTEALVFDVDEDDSFFFSEDFQP